MGFHISVLRRVLCQRLAWKRGKLMLAAGMISLTLKIPDAHN
jgi:hypothetical protein